MHPRKDAIVEHFNAVKNEAKWQRPQEYIGVESSQNETTDISKLLENTEMCVYSMFFFETATVTDSLYFKARLTPPVLDKSIEQGIQLQLQPS